MLASLPPCDSFVDRPAFRGRVRAGVTYPLLASAKPRSLFPGCIFPGHLSCKENQNPLSSYLHTFSWYPQIIRIINLPTSHAR